MPISSPSIPPPANSYRATVRRELRWDAAFIGVLFYLIIDYTRLPAMFPVLIDFQIAKLSVALATLGLLFSRRVQPLRPLRSSLIEKLLLVYLFAGLMSAVMASDQVSAWIIFTDMVRWVAVAILIGRVVSSKWRIQTLLLFFVLLNLKLAQFQLRTYKEGVDLGVRADWLARGVGAGSTGFFANSNDFGLAMCVAWPIAGALGVAESRRWRQLVCLVTFLTILAALLLSASRGAMLGAAAAAVIAWAKNPKRLVGPLMIGVLLVGGYYILPEAHKERVLSAVHYQQDSNAQTRLTLWSAAWDMFLHHPLLGVGPGNFARTMATDPDYKQFSSVVGFVPHSIYLHPMAETGFLGAAPLFAAWILAFQMNRRTAAQMTVQDGFRFEHYIADGLNVSLASFFISGAFLTVLFYPHIWFLLGMTMGLHRWSSQVELPMAEPATRFKGRTATFFPAATPKEALSRGR